jgi:hypothetical protein
MKRTFFNWWFFLEKVSVVDNWEEGHGASHHLRILENNSFGKFQSMVMVEAKTMQKSEQN